MTNDQIVKRLLDHLDATVGKDRYILALTADHGICPLPEVSRAQGKDAGRVPAETLGAVTVVVMLLSSYAGIRCFPPHLAAELGRSLEAQVFLDRQVTIQFSELQDSFHFRFIRADDRMDFCRRAFRFRHQKPIVAVPRLLQRRRNLCAALFILSTCRRTSNCC